jgi:hypothetical protein
MIALGQLHGCSLLSVKEATETAMFYISVNRQKAWEPHRNFSKMCKPVFAFGVPEQLANSHTLTARTFMR